VTEAEWNSSTDPQAMLEFLRDSGKLSERKARLFAVAVCRRIWHLLTDEQNKRAVEVADLYADGVTSRQKMKVAQRKAADAPAAPGMTLASFLADSAATWACYVAPDSACPAVRTLSAADKVASLALGAAAAVQSSSVRDSKWDKARSHELMAQAALLRDIFGNPFHPLPRMDANVLAWRDGTVVRLAQAAYEERLLPSGHLDPDRLAVLADALEEAGSTDAELIGHLRSPGPHIRGCFVVDLLLARS
jgi:hypothetical protein